MPVLNSRRGNKLARQVNSAWFRYAQAWFPRSYGQSPHPLTVVIPLAEKDIGIAGACVAAARRHLRHPIARIVVPGQPSARIADFCRKEGLEYRDERSVLDRRVLDFEWRAAGQNRRGWIRQQFLKLTVAEWLEGERFLVLDADTLLARDLAFMEGERQILWRADDLVEDYYAFTEAVIGPVTRRNYSCVSHCMLLQRGVLDALKVHIESRAGTDWIVAMLNAIQTGTLAGMSEYELYAHFLMRERPDAFRLRYWYNRKADLDGPRAIETSLRRHARFNFLSDHNQKRADPGGGS